MIRRALILMICFSSALTFPGCKEEVGTLGFPAGPNDKSYSLTFTDTTTVYTSTVLLDSVPTLNTGMLLIGRYTDEKLGVVKATPYFQVSLNGTSWLPADDVVFDSIALRMNYNGYFYGDTTQAQTFEVRQLTDDFKTHIIPAFWISQGYYSALYSPNTLWNISTVPADEAATLGTFTLKPRPASRDSIRVRLKDAIGQQWLADARIAVNSPFSSTYNFSQYFRGITIRSTTPDATAVLGLATTNKLNIRFYYHQFANGLLVHAHQDFPFISSQSGSLFNFNNIVSDRSATALKTLSITHNEIPSRLTSEETYIQSGVGLVTKIKLPHLRRLLDAPGFIRLNSARLVIEPIKNTYDPLHNLPPKLKLWHTNRSNLPLSAVQADFSASVQESALVAGNDINSKPAYAFSITQYAQAVLSSTGNGEDEAFFISATVDDLERTVDRVILGSGQRSDYRIRVEVYYLKQNL